MESLCSWQCDLSFEKLFSLFSYLCVCLCVYVCVYAHVSRCLWRPERVSDPLERALQLACVRASTLDHGAIPLASPMPLLKTLMGKPLSPGLFLLSLCPGDVCGSRGTNSEQRQCRVIGWVGLVAGGSCGRTCVSQMQVIISPVRSRPPLPGFPPHIP